ncbi:A/G-specific adenine glycosylase [Schaalia sp. lx-100]|uniref:A/G-specific adenine glycosylase n=1 Tax=Schaalia sp. lx-100 TaxID=2899081 RepID=UPI002F2B4999
MTRTSSALAFPHPHPPTLRQLRTALYAWFDEAGRNLPMRRDDVTPWGTLVFEVMSQQTPIPRVQPIWLRWMELWPTPADLAEAPRASVLVEWDCLGYPSRALRLQDCAQAIASRPGGEVPAHYDDLLALPGIGPYTASALASFQFYQRLPVLDTNIRRVLTRIFGGRAYAPSGAPTRKEVTFAHALLPRTGKDCARWNLTLMEFGALACTQRSPACETCPVRSLCAWAENGFPASDTPVRTQAWVGTDRQARGRVIGLLRQLHRQGKAPFISYAQALEAASLPGAPADQAARVMKDLLRDGLISVDSSGKVSLPQ